MIRSIIIAFILLVSNPLWAAGPNFGEGTIIAGGGSKITPQVQCNNGGVSAIALAVSNSDYDITQISLPAGEWNVSGSVFYVPGAGATMTSATSWTTTTSATLPPFPNAGGTTQWKGSYANTAVMGYPVGTRHYSLTVPTTVYLGARAVFAGGTMSAYGCINVF